MRFRWEKACNYNENKVYWYKRKQSGKLCSRLVRRIKWQKIYDGMAVGVFELDNLVACFVALDAASKAANVTIQSVERNPTEKVGHVSKCVVVCPM